MRRYLNEQTLILFKRLNWEVGLTLEEMEQSSCLQELMAILQEEEAFTLRHPVVAMGLRIPRNSFLEAVALLQVINAKHERPSMVLNNGNPWPRYYSQAFHLGVYENPKWGFIEAVGNQNQQGLVLIVSTLHPTLFSQRLLRIGMQKSGFQTPWLPIETKTEELAIFAELKRNTQIFIQICDWNLQKFFPENIKEKPKSAKRK